MYTGFAEKFSKPISRPPPPAPLPPPPPSLPTPRTITTSDPESARERAGSGTRPGRQYSSNSCLRRTRLAWSCHHSLLPGFLQSPGPQAGASCRLLGVDGEEGGELHTPPRLRAGEGGRSPPKPLGWSARPKRVEVGDSEPRGSDPPHPPPPHRGRQLFRTSSPPGPARAHPACTPRGRAPSSSCPRTCPAFVPELSGLEGTASGPRRPRRGQSAALGGCPPARRVAAAAGAPAGCAFSAAGGGGGRPTPGLEAPSPRSPAAAVLASFFPEGEPPT